MLIFDLEQDWQPRGISNGKPHFTCIVCQDGLERKAADCKAHERTQGHVQRLRNFKFKSPLPEGDGRNLTSSTTTSQASTNRALTEDALRALLISATSQPNQPRYSLGHPNHNVHDPTHSRSGSPATSAGFNWGLYEIENTIADPTPQERLLNDISQATLEFLNEDISDFEDDGDLSDSDNDAGTCSSY